MKKLIVIMTILAIVLSTFGCSKYLQVKEDPCTVPESAGSILCDNFNKIGISAYDADLFFKLANVELIKHNVYTKEAAVGFLNDLDNMLENTTYSNFAAYVISKINNMNNDYGMEIAIVMDYMNRFKGIEVPINSYDVYLIKQHIKNQKALLGVY